MLGAYAEPRSWLRPWHRHLLAARALRPPARRCQGVVKVPEGLGRQHTRALEQQLLACPYYPGLRLPRYCLRGNLATAMQTRHTFSVQPVMLLACRSSHRVMENVGVFVGEAEHYCCTHCCHGREKQAHHVCCMQLCWPGSSWWMRRGKPK